MLLYRALPSALCGWQRWIAILLDAVGILTLDLPPQIKLSVRPFTHNIPLFSFSFSKHRMNFWELKTSSATFGIVSRLHCRPNTEEAARMGGVLSQAATMDAKILSIP